ncbi:tetratricopeptide repeat protein [Litorimonas taeanensis]|uniref:Tetratricopeptide repeat protein n=1 Tax=Litorimonas taeanensis TaxID=568099 RepID=A0A420WIX9_9PROT|nr:tetratricopeptide repeat protein [Litorimonas taeanensis]RKQ70882.1 tetratricopeptide repeat protein [Litorimonas taeanensis]
MTSLTKMIRNGLSASAFVLMSAAFVSVPVTAYAQDDAQTEGRQFSAKSGEMVSAANEMMTANQFQAAVSKLNEALALPDLNAYERSIIYQVQGTAYYELNNYGSAITAFENAISAGGLLPNEASSLRVNIAQLLIGNGQFAEGAQMLENYLARGGQEKPKYVEYITQAWVQAENYNRALPWAEKWFNAASPKERKHFDLLNFLYNNLGMPGKQADIVKQMINRWPEEKQLWEAWASMLANGGREQEAFEVTKMLYIGGALTTEQDLMKVVQYYSFYDMPFQAAEILEREMSNGRIPRDSEKMVQLSNLFRQAREYKRAIPILEQAASSSNQAKLYADLGEALYNEGECQRAEAAFKGAIDRGYDAGKSWMLIATCRYEATQNQESLSCEMSPDQMANAPITKTRASAVEAFSQVPSTSRENRNAKKWISFIRAERDAFDRRCEFEKNIERELCYQMIKGAYDNEIFEGEFKLEDENCQRFKADYDAAYIVKTTG